MKPKVFVTRKIPGEGIALLQQRCDVKVAPQNAPISRKELLKGAKWADALLTLLTDKIDAEVMDANPNLKIIANYAVGYDNIAIPEATKRGIPVTNTPGVLTESVAEHAVALMLAVGKRLLEADPFLRAGKYKSWDPFLLLGTEFDGKTVGVVGTGRIGSVFVKVARAMNMNVLYNDVNRNAEMEQQFQAQYVDLDTLLKQSDVVSIHVPLLPTTRHLIDANKLKLMKKTAILINTSRGPIVDEKALVAALKKNQIRGAGLDVFEFEPKLAPGLAKLKNVVVTPHIASATEEARNEMSKLAAKNILAVLSGEIPPALVNKDVVQTAWKRTGA
ncbi:MAG TPA: D-glycerate dehydrogenase [Candidatus Binatia bacterium]|nr:D-glycerate dehydrogenase [Candidatus Binatia bacterium]